MSEELAFSSVPRHLVVAVIRARNAVWEYPTQALEDRLHAAERDLIEAAIDDIS